MNRVLLLSIALTSQLFPILSWAQGIGFRGTPTRFQRSVPAPSTVQSRGYGPGFDGVYYQNNRFIKGEPAGVGFQGQQPSLFIDQAPTVFPDQQVTQPEPIGFQN